MFSTDAFAIVATVFMKTQSRKSTSVTTSDTSHILSATEILSIFQSVPGLYLILKPDAPKFTIVAVSDEYCKATMIKREVVLGKGLFEVFPDNPNDICANGVKNLTASLEHVLTHKETHKMEIQKYDIHDPRTKLFEQRYWSPLNVPVVSRSGEVLYIVHSVVDVSKTILSQKNAKIAQQRADKKELENNQLSKAHRLLQASEEKLIESERRFRSLSMYAPVGIFQTDKDGNCIFVNKRWCALAGMTAKEAKGKGWIKALHHDDKERVLKEWYKAAKTENEFQSEYRFQTRKGIVSWLHGSSIKLTDKNGDTTGYLGTIVDITAKKRAEEQAQETSNLLKTILDTAPIGFCLFDKELRFQMINKMLADINGFTPQEHIGKTIQEIIPSIKKEATRELKHVLKTGKPILGLELTGETKSEPGKIKHWKEDYFPVRSVNGKIIGIGALVLDVTEKRKQERLKDEFLGIASHELKTPVTSLKAFGQVIQSKLAKDGHDAPVQLLGKMDVQINKLTTLIEDLLDISKIEAGRLQFHDDLFAFDSLVDEIIEEVQRTTQKHTLIRKGQTRKMVIADRERIGQVLTNFLTNAIKYSPQNEKILIQTSVNTKEIQLCVKDFGVGIPKDTLPHLFERFYRVKGKTHDTVPGMGLGLYIASEIIKREGGRIWAESEKGKGSCFYFTLPIQE